jgi:Ca2+-binding RTX toxin-like protein
MAFHRSNTIDTGNGDDIITGIGGDTGIDSRVNTTIYTGDGNDISQLLVTWVGILLLNGTIDTGEAMT